MLSNLVLTKRAVNATSNTRENKKKAHLCSDLSHVNEIYKSKSNMYTVTVEVELLDQF